jgi:uncharacterized protein (DUF2147 family)
MKKIFFLNAMLFLATISFAQSLSSDKIVGVWLTEDKDLKIEIFKTGNAYSGKLLWSKEMFEADGKTSKKDDKNPNDKLKSRPWQGIVHITGLTYEDGEYIDGELYRPQDGNMYSLKAELKSINKLETRGYMGVPMMGKTFKWTRVE